MSRVEKKERKAPNRYSVMAKRVCIIVVLIMTFAETRVMSGAPAESETSREYEIKAAFLYNFVKFTDWPAKPAASSNDTDVVDSNEPVIIGIIGTDPFGKAFEPLKNKPAKGREVIMKRFKGLGESKSPDEQIEALKKCHVLFVCRSPQKQIKRILDSVQDSPLLTVADTSGFLESGGIINFVTEGKKVRFEINNTAARRAKLKLRSKLLRLAKRVVEEKPSESIEK